MRVKQDDMTSFRDLRPMKSLARARRFAVLAVALTVLTLAAVAGAFFLPDLTSRQESVLDLSSAPGFLAASLGQPQSRADAAAKRSRIKVQLHEDGVTIDKGGTHVSLAADVEARSGWSSFENGRARKTPYGLETVVVGANSVEESLLVDEHRGSTTWRWRLGSLDLDSRLVSDGSVAITTDHRVGGLVVKPVRILDRAGRDVTPRHARWSISKLDGATWLELKLDDRALPAPYVIDPTVVVSACNVTTAPTSVAGCRTYSGTVTTFAMQAPTGIQVGDVLIALVMKHNTGAFNAAPAGWTQIGSQVVSTSIGEAAYWHVATATDVSAPPSYTFSWGTSNAAVGAIVAYDSVDQTNPVDASGTNSGTTGAWSASATTTAANEVVVGLFGMGDATTAVTMGQTQRVNVSFSGGVQAAKKVRLAMNETTRAAAGAQTMTSTTNPGLQWVGMAVALNAAPDGDGTMSVAPTSVPYAGTGQTLTFTYTASAAGMVDGSISVTMPAGWTAPQTGSSGGAGYVSVTCAACVNTAPSIAAAGQVATISSVSLPANGTLTLTYANATASSVSGTATFTTKQRADNNTGGALTNIAVQPTVNVLAPDGSGTMSVAPTSAVAGSTGAYTFTYTPQATGGLLDGSVSPAIPAGWTTPQSTTPGSAGYTTASGGTGTNTISYAAGVLTVSGVTLTPAQTLTITYGSGNQATAQTTVGTPTFTAKEASSSVGTLTALGASPTVTVNPGPAATLSVSASPTTVTAGGATTVTMTAKDQYGNTATGYTGTVHFTSSDAQAVKPADYPFVAGDLGTKGFSVTLKTAPSATVTATDTVTGTITGTTGSVTVNPAAASLVQISAATTDLTSGSPRVLTATLEDPYGNTITSDNSTSVSFTQSAGTGTVTGTGSATVTAGVATKTVSGGLVGTVTMQASAGALTTTTVGFNVVVGPAAKVVFTSGTGSVASGSGKTLTAEVRDAAGNLETGDNTTSVTFAKTAGTGTVTGLGAATASGGVATLSATGQLVGSLTVTASSGALATDTSTFTVTVGPAANVVFTSGTSSVASGSTKTLTAEIRDAAGNLETGDNTTSVTFAKTAGTGTVTGLGSATVASGVATVTVTGQLASALTVTASSGALATDTSSFSVTPGSAAKVAFTSSTASVASGSAKTLTAEVQDAAGNLVTGDNTTSVTFAKSSGAGTVTGLASATAGGGIATLDVTGALAGAITVDATATGLTGDSSSFSVVPGPATDVVFTSNTNSVASGSGKTLTAEIRDAAGNLETGDNSTSVTFAKTAGTGTVTGLGSATASSGVATLTATGQLVGSVTVTASSGSLGSGTSSFSVTVGPADKVVVTSNTSSVASGSNKILTAEIRDAAGNLETGDNTSSVTFAKSGGAGTLGGLASATASSGVATLNVTGALAGAVTVDATATGLTGDSTSFDVTVGPAANVVFTSNTSSVASGSTKTLTAEIRDAAGNLETGDNSTSVTFAKTAGTGTVTGLGSATVSGGVASVTATGQLVGGVTVTASATSLASDTSAFNVTAGPAATVVFTSGTGSVASGSTKTLTAEVRDAAGNLETGDNTTSVTFAKDRKSVV